MSDMREVEKRLGLDAEMPEHQFLTTFDAVFDWLENQVTGGNTIAIEPSVDGRMQVRVTELSESQDRDCEMITLYRGQTLLEAIKLAMEGHQ